MVMTSQHCSLGQGRVYTPVHRSLATEPCISATGLSGTARFLCGWTEGFSFIGCLPHGLPYSRSVAVEACRLDLITIRAAPSTDCNRSARSRPGLVIRMGLDGGTYITRSDVLRGQSWDLASSDANRSTRGGAVSSSTVWKRRELDLADYRNTKWTCCTLTGLPLQAPIVADLVGNLYNREALIEFLLGRCGTFADQEAEHRYINQLREAQGAFDHLASTRDVFIVHLESAEGASASTASPSYSCPITNLPCGAQHAFLALRPCGHVFSSKALQNVSQTGSCACSTCSKPYEEADVIQLVPDPAMRDKLLSDLQQRQAEQRAARANKKKRKVVQIAGVDCKPPAAVKQGTC